MKKSNALFECVECGYQSPKFYGRCPQCSAWNAMVETQPLEISGKGKTRAAKPQPLTEVNHAEKAREITGMAEFDRVLGGGIVAGSVVLIGGEPGVGKSTLLLEIAGHINQKGKKTLYFSGEESASQIKLRAERLKIEANHILLLNMGSLEDVKTAVAENRPDVLIIDSIQTIPSSGGPQVTGSLSSMRYATSEIIEIAKTDQIPVFIIGHITKEGQLAGPKSLEHMVDVVLYFHGEMESDLRILRAEKNRFGPVNELGIFQMTSEGLKSVQDPTQIFIHHRNKRESGISIFPVMKGLRAFLIEIQALVTESPFAGNPRRISIGFDSYRMAMLISIIEKKLRLPFYKSDVFLNVTAGITIKDTAADLAILAALLSSYKNTTPLKDYIFIGEVGLTGEIRPVSFIENRIKEAQRQGFKNFILAESPAKRLGKNGGDITIFEAKNIYDLTKYILKKM